MENNNSDRRKHPRVNVEKAIYIEVVGKRGNSEADNTIFRCETLDVSVSGLRISIPVSIPRGSILNIAVPMEDWKESLELVAEAMWIREADNKEGWWVGLALKDSSRTDMEKWFRVVHRLKNHSAASPAETKVTGE